MRPVRCEEGMWCREVPDMYTLHIFIDILLCLLPPHPPHTHPCRIPQHYGRRRGPPHCCVGGRRPPPCWMDVWGLGRQQALQNIIKYMQSVHIRCPPTTFPPHNMLPFMTMFTHSYVQCTISIDGHSTSTIFAGYDYLGRYI